MSNIKNNNLKMFDIVVHQPTGFIFKFFQYEDDKTCSVMDELELMYSFPINSIKEGSRKDMDVYEENTAKKFQHLRKYL
ncbi:MULTISPECIES: hypothetical protein [Oceanobacillus]|uniref:Uncharacterized protein n=1 Tax=Oceanobacillus kimchii TaxID=746691 RepID=A0ABQ5TQT2_9BACI|nr:hypothetical protein [Oceanobacillus kimchii]GLO68261.1 hypothetical protein MACH08_40450 [Oceanobacillus kimchii]